MKPSTKMWLTTRTHLRRSLLAAGIGAAALGVASLFAAPGDITFTTFPNVFPNPIGIDFLENPNAPNGIGDLIVSGNYPLGQPSNLVRIVVPSGDEVPFSILNGLTDELKIASVRTSPGCQAFPVGDVFTGTGTPGEIVRISGDGVIRPVAAINPGGPLSGGGNSWVQLPGELSLLRGSLYVDRSCAFGGDLIVVTASGPTGGNIWRVNEDGAAQLLASAGPNVHLEGVLTLPNDPRYGPWAGTIIAGNENSPQELRQSGAIYSITAAGVVTVYDLSFTDTGGLQHPMKPEDLDLIEAGDAFFGVNYQDRRLLSAPSSDFATFVGDVLFTQEIPCGSTIAITDCTGLSSGQTTSGLYAIRYVGTGGNAVGGLFNATPFKFSPESVINSVNSWEHVTLSPLGNPHLKVTKTPDNATFRPGDPLSFTIVVMSDGVGAARNVTLRDPLPTAGELTWSVTSVTPVRTCTIGAGQVLNCSLGDLNANAAVTIVVTSTNAGGAPVASCTGSKIVNTATATSTNAQPAMDTGEYTCTPIPAIRIVKKTNGTDNDTVPGPTVAVGSTVTWTYLVTNTGDDPIGGVLVTDDNGTPGNTADDFTATYSSGDTNANALLDVTENWTFTASRTATLGQYENFGTVTGTGRNSNRTVTDKNVDHYFGAPTRPNITIKKLGNGLVKLGDVAKFTIVVTNVGPGSANGVKVSDELPAGFEWTDNRATCTITAGVMRCGIGTMTEGQVFTVVLRAKTTVAAFARNCVRLIHHHGDHCEHERGQKGHRDGDGCEHEKTKHYDGDRCDHERGRSGHRDGDGCEHDKDTHRVACRIHNTAVVTATNEDPGLLGDNSSTGSIWLVRPTHHAGDRCDHERRKDGHKDRDGCEHEQATHHHYSGDDCDHARGRKGHYSGDGCDHERTVRPDENKPRHFDGDRCDHERGRPGHRDGDGCHHDNEKKGRSSKEAPARDRSR